MFKNRLEKNFKKLKPWALRNGIEAFRIYDRDIPEIQFIVDLYADHAVIYDKTDAFLDKDKNLLPEIIQAVQTVTNVNVDKIVVKKRERQEGSNQYEKIAEVGHTFWINEGSAKLKVNLHDYLDTGLFLDHRPMRHWVFKNCSGKRFLNLFCYTGSVTVFAALGKAAETVSVDMSATYLSWAMENLKANGHPEAGNTQSNHKFIQENALEFLAEHKGEYDLIFLDPPTFSNSKRMDSSFEVERDQDYLIENCMRLLSPHGLLIFSNNKRKFKLSEAITSKFAVQDMTEKSIPMDYHDQKIHKCFFIRFKRS